MFLPPTVRAEARLENLGLITADQGAQFSAQLAIELPTAVDDALHRGVPLFFNAEVNLYQERWYWTDNLVARSQRYWRLSYQALTRRYRLQSSQQPIDNSGLGVGLAQTHDSLTEALSALQRISAWSLSIGPLDEGSRHRLEFRFRLEPNALLRPWLSGANEGEWGLSVQRSQPLRVGGRP
ncbi:MAG: DUF4390 domain-containing protein [Alphaproteobacteria bacterium]|nr:DUF4390 domain-containing protein [Alphaproteobacteria bacterium]MDI9329953.1 DUF4390 domain-containing protein [Alphaproteobacteria bacterium]